MVLIPPLTCFVGLKSRTFVARFLSPTDFVVLLFVATMAFLFCYYLAAKFSENQIEYPWARFQRLSEGAHRRAKMGLSFQEASQDIE